MKFHAEKTRITKINEIFQNTPKIEKSDFLFFRFFPFFCFLKNPRSYPQMGGVRGIFGGDPDKA